MKTSAFVLTLLSLGLGTALSAAETAAPGAYPLTTCVVSDEPLGEMGKPVEYVYKEEGKPDRVVKLCCKGCVRDFKKDPAKYLSKLDAAPADAAKSAAHAH